MSVLWQLLAALPEILKLIEEIQKNSVELETKRKVADDIKVIHQAFAAKDSKKLNDLFNSK